MDIYKNKNYLTKADKIYSYRPYTFHLVYPCNKCSKSYHPSNFNKWFSPLPCCIFFLLLSLGLSRAYWDTFSTVQLFHCFCQNYITLVCAVKHVKWKWNEKIIQYLNTCKEKGAITFSNLISRTPTKSQQPQPHVLKVSDSLTKIRVTPAQGLKFSEW